MTTENNINENSINENSAVELNEALMEEVSGGKKAATVVCKVSEANVRSGPGKDFAIIGHLYRGEKVSFKGEKKKDKEGKIWYCVNKGTKFGWIRSDLIA